MIEFIEQSERPEYDPDMRIAAAYEEELPQALELLARGFANIITADDIDFLRTAIQDSFAQGHMICLRYREEFVGFINGVGLGDELSMPLAEYVQRRIKLCTSPHLYEHTFDEYRRRAMKYGSGRAIVKYGDSEFNNAVPIVQANDYYIQTLVIDERFRRQGYGGLLLGSFLEELRLLDAGRVFSDCLEGTGSEVLLKKHGFQGMGRFGPSHQSGQSSLFVARYLNYPDWYEGLSVPVSV